MTKLTPIEIQVPAGMLKLIRAQATKRDMQPSEVVLMFLANEIKRQANAAKGRQDAIKRGATMGRPRVLDAKQVRDVQRMRQKGATLRHIASRFEISQATVGRALGYRSERAPGP